MLSQNLLAGGLLLVGAAASPVELFGRGPESCNRDNLLRCVIDTRFAAQASAFCAELEPSTTTVATVTASETTTVGVEAVETFTETVTKVTTVFTATLPGETVTVTDFYSGPYIYSKRDEAPAAAPACMTNRVTYPAARITSACSCIDVPAQTVSVTHTSGTITFTETTPIPTTITETATAAETVSTDTVAPPTTITVPHPPLVNMDFEKETIENWEKYQYSGRAEAFEFSAVRRPGPYGPETFALKMSNNLYEGEARLDMTQKLILEGGRRYRLRLSAATTAVATGNSISGITAYVWGRPFRPLPIILPFQNGQPQMNGWILYSFDFEIPVDKGGEMFLLFGFMRHSTQTSIFLDDITIQPL